MYIQSTTAAEIPDDAVAEIGRLAGLDLPPDVVHSIAEALKDQITGDSRLRELALGDLDGVNPASAFNPQWDD
jgi:hypothetical protein